ncbi:MAG: hypothetical protein RLZZ337_21 [Bacteroidota bacterium]|jgi:peptidoglycan hydrolase CwlO-like protein
MRTINVLSIFVIIASLFACSSGNPTFISNVEQLQDSLSANGKNLSFDITPFQQRIEEMSTNYTRLKQEIKNTLTLEEGNTFDKYKSIMKTYKRNVSTYNDCLKEQKELEVQVSNLLSDVKNGKLSDDEFRTYFNQEKSDISLLIQRTNEIKKSIYEVEPEFRRVSDFVYSKLDPKKEAN